MAAPEAPDQAFLGAGLDARKGQLDGKDLAFSRHRFPAQRAQSDRCGRHHVRGPWWNGCRSCSPSHGIKS